MKEQVMVYVISANANSNANKLFSKDRKYFYWNSLMFRNLSVNDYVFVVNKTGKYVLFTKIEEQSIPTQIITNLNKTTFSDKGETFQVDGTQSRNTPWSEFVRLKIIKELPVEDNWEWQSLGAGENTYLNGTNISLGSAHNRIKNIDQLKQITQDKDIIAILNACKANFTDKPIVQKNIVQVDEKGQLYNPPHDPILTAIKTKPFILLAGLSGTGKSRLVRTLAYKTCAKQELRTDERKPGNFELIPVRPNWHDSTELMGYISRINGEKYVTTPFLHFISKAWKYPDIPFFLCLDEMNLAPVEQYFAEYLSIIETRQRKNNEVVTDYLLPKSCFDNPHLYKQVLTDLQLENDKRFEEGISIPTNLIVIGTVNMDETTHSFSRKVLDRAMTFEMNVVDLNAGLDESDSDWSYPPSFIDCKTLIGEYTAGAEVANRFNKKNDVLEFLKKINHELEGTPFKIAYRVRDEFLIYCYHASEADNKNSDWLTNALDEMTSMKILSRIEGDETKTGNILRNLQKVLTPDYKKSNSKLREMEARLVNSGYTSFWS